MSAQGSIKSEHPLYVIYIQMLARCCQPNNPRYADYGGRGITVCERWLSDFWTFAADMGDRPAGLTLDRTDNDSGYSPENCRWATYQEQRQNRRPEKPRQTCRNGHEYLPENTRVGRRGHRECIICADAQYERRQIVRRGTRQRKAQASTKPGNAPRLTVTRIKRKAEAA